jgi:hypothetical protein
MHRKKEDTQEEPATALQKRNNRCICLMKEKYDLPIQQERCLLLVSLSHCKGNMGIQMDATEMNCNLPFI